MIIWINGAFGSGKTQTAYELRRRLRGAYVYDPENAGCFIRDNLPPAVCVDDFQDYPMWRKFNLDMLRYIAEHYTGDIIVPMTLTNRAYFEEIAGALSREYDVRHVILCAQKETILKRLASRLEGRRSWAARQIDRCIRAFDGDIPGMKLHTDGLSIRQTAEEVAALAGVTLMPDNRSGARRALDRFLSQCGHIR